MERRIIVSRESYSIRENIVFRTNIDLFTKRNIV